MDLFSKCPAGIKSHQLRWEARRKVFDEFIPEFAHIDQDFSTLWGTPYLCHKLFQRFDIIVVFTKSGEKKWSNSNQRALNAMISGVPTLVQNVGHHTFLLRGYSGSFNDEASLYKLLQGLQTDLHLLEKIQAEGLALAKAASPAAVAQQYVQMFDNVLSCKNAWKRAFFFDIFGR